jgi:hypothetical protein
MNRIALLLATLIAGLAPVAEGQQLYESIDHCTETSTDSVTLPVTVPYRMTVQPCPTCKALQLAVDANTRFFVGEQAVTLAELRAQSARGVRQLNVCRASGTDRLTRIVMAGRLDAATTRPKSTRPVR